MNRKNVLAAAIAVALVPPVAAGYLHLRSPLLSEAQAAISPSVPNTTVALPDFTSLVTQAGPAVVAIRVTQTLHNTAFNGLPPGIDPSSPLFEFFKRFGGPQMGQGPSGGDEVAQGVGSGFIISPDGYILTNAHVVADADEVEVKLTDKREFKAKVIGVDRKSDVAVIRIDAKDLPTLRIGDANALKVGEWVAAIGSPFGLENTVTAGVVSAKSRLLPDDAYVPFIQTDVAVNPGNSGGPLLNMRGEVIGINSQIYSRSGGYMGLSFAIPIDVAMKVGDTLRHDGKIEHGRLGVHVQSMNQDLAQSFGLKTPNGALISEVESNSPAAKAGVKSGDVIVAVNDQLVEDSVTLSRLVADMKPGDRAHLRIFRQGQTSELTATIGVADGETLADASGPNDHAAPAGRLGVSVRPLAPDEQKQLGETGGVLVERSSGAAAKAGIRQGDVILAVNAERIHSAEQLKSLINDAKGQIALLVKRDDAEIYVPVALS
ncbi:MAG: DegQ family serine endoprotease [Gammaproteobacteria bacterium]